MYLICKRETKWCTGWTAQDKNGVSVCINIKQPQQLIKLVADQNEKGDILLKYLKMYLQNMQN